MENLELQTCHFGLSTLTLPFKQEHRDNTIPACEKWNHKKQCLVTKKMRMVVEYTRYRVKTKSKPINLKINS